MSRNLVINAKDALRTGLAPRSIEACADWNDEMAATAYVRGDVDEAARHWGQSGRLRETARALETLQHVTKAA